ncbi:MAG TPA: DinB family protein [Bryobacteraceae bacterium]|nr:DinB family protein [Bryobacteraceae bacterium]
MPTTETLPADIQKLITELNQNDAGAKQVMLGLTSEQLNWQPHNGKAWSILQCFDHLILANKGYLDSMWPLVRGTNAAKTPRKGPIKPGLFAKWFLGTVEPPAKLKTPTVDTLVPPSRGDRDQVLAAYVKTNDDLRALLQAGAGIDLNALTMTNPFIKQLNVNVGTAILLIAAHERRHTWQAGEVRKVVEASGRTTT